MKNAFQLFIVVSLLTSTTFAEKLTVSGKINNPLVKLGVDNSGDPSEAQAALWKLYESDNKMGLVGWLTKGQSHSLPTYHCSGFYARQLLRQGATASEQAAVLQPWIDSCKSQFQRNVAAGDLSALFETFTLRTKMSLNRLVKPISFTLSDGRILKGILAMIPDGKKRPLVIGRCGVYCDGLGGSTGNAFVAHMFEESHNNVIFLESISSTEYTTTNKEISVSGFDEAGQMFDISQNLDIIDPTLKNLTTEINFVGYSLGGHAALYTALLSSLNESALPIRSVLAVCPVVDLQKQIDFLFKAKSIRGTIVTFFNRLLFKTLNRIFPIFSDEDLANITFDNEGMKKIVSINNLRFYQRNTDKLYFSKLNPFKGVQINDFDDFWRLSRWQDYASMIKVPLLVIGNRDDDVVSYNLNTAVIDPKASDQVGIIKFLGGNHCGDDVHAGWNATSQIVNGFINSYGTYSDEQVAFNIPTMKYDNASAASFGGYNRVYSYVWDIHNPKKATLQVWTAEKTASCIVDYTQRCREEEFHTYDIDFPLTVFKNAGIPATVTNIADQALVSRYLNANAQVLGPKGQDWRIDPGVPSQVIMPKHDAIAEEKLVSDN